MFWDTASGTMKPTGEYVKSFVDGVCEVCCAWVAINRSQARGVLLTWGETMKQLVLLFATLLGLLHSHTLWGQARTYIYTGPVWESFDNFKEPCAAGLCANYPIGSRAAGRFTTAAPIVSNLTPANILPQVISFSFSDGLNTYSSIDPNVRAESFIVGTDADGNIVVDSFGIVVEIWQTGSSPHVVGDRFAINTIRAAYNGANNNSRCIQVGTSPNTAVPDLCNIGIVDFSESDASTGFPGSWTNASVAVPTPVLSFWASVLLSLLTATVACRALRKRNGNQRSR